MTGTATEPADQPITRPMVSSGVTPELGPYDAKALIGNATPFYTFSSEWVLVWNGSTLTFRPGAGYQLDAPLLAALTVAGAPITAV